MKRTNLLLLFSMLLIFIASISTFQSLALSSNVYIGRWGDGDWDDSWCEWATSGAVAETYHEDSTLLGRLRIGVFAALWGEAIASGTVVKEFTYTHPARKVTFRIGYFRRGVMIVAAASAEYYTKVKLYDVTDGMDLDEYKYGDHEEIDFAGYKEFEGDDTIILEEDLQTDHTYQIRFEAYCDVFSLGTSDASVDFYDSDPPDLIMGGRPLYVDLRCIEVYYPGYYAHSRVVIGQNRFPVANNLEFTAYVREDAGAKPAIDYYRVSIDRFPTVNCQWGDPGPDHYEVDVRAEGADISLGDECRIDVEFWLKGPLACTNQVRRKYITWTYYVEGEIALPNHGWLVSLNNNVVIYNEDDTRSFTITDFAYHISANYYYNLAAVPFDTSIAGEFTLLPGESKYFELSGSIAEGHVYFYYKMLETPGGNILMEEWADHQIYAGLVAVGGTWIPVDKFDLLAPYIGLASTIIVATVATAIYVKRRKGKQ